MRRRNIKDAKLKITKYSNILINPTEFIDIKSLFNNEFPVHLEIGMGKGKFIIEHALRNPNINYIGIEKFESVILQALVKKEELNLNNLYMICMDASNLSKVIPSNSIDQIYLNFSDPWPKKRHSKRRLTSSIFIKEYQEISKKPQKIAFKTDNRALFEYSLCSFNNNGYKFLNISLDLHTTNNEVITTEYEERFKKLGKPIYYIEVSK